MTYDPSTQSMVARGLVETILTGNEEVVRKLLTIMQTGITDGVLSASALTVELDAIIAHIRNCQAVIAET